MSKLIIINADDFGLCEGVNRAIAEAHTKRHPHKHNPYDKYAVSGRGNQNCKATSNARRRNSSQPYGRQAALKRTGRSPDS